jgi:uncharacterized membrane protein YeaQ/YmgE (transglycosylase-associated protein family)
MNFIIFLVVGAVAGYFADKVVKNTFGRWVDMLIGIAGSFVSDFILGLFGYYADTVLLQVIVAFIGAVVLLLVINFVKGRKKS